MLRFLMSGAFFLLSIICFIFYCFNFLNRNKGSIYMNHILTYLMLHMIFLALGIGYWLKIIVA